MARTIDNQTELSTFMRTPAQLRGAWRITEMELWGADTLDLLGQAHIAFEPSGTGSFVFIAVQGEADCRFAVDEGRHRVDFSWEGDDDGHPATGRGWASLVAPDRLEGRLYFHMGDDSSFVAHRVAVAKRPAKRR